MKILNSIFCLIKTIQWSFCEIKTIWITFHMMEATDGHWAWICLPLHPLFGYLFQWQWFLSLWFFRTSQQWSQQINQLSKVIKSVFFNQSTGHMGAKSSTYGEHYIFNHSAHFYKVCCTIGLASPHPHPLNTMMGGNQLWKFELPNVTTSTNLQFWQ